MLSDKDTGIKKLIFERICRLDEEVVESDPEYRELGKRPQELLQLIAAQLAPEAQKLLQEYDNSYFDQIIRRDELYYSRGLMDGIALCYWVVSVGRGEAELKV